MAQEPFFGVEVRHLSALVAIAQEGSFRGAADRLGYVQSAISQQVASLERLVGARLVERFRGSKEVELSEAGELLVAHANKVLTQLYAARADLTAHANGGQPGTLRLGMSHQSATAGLVASLLRRLAHQAPEIQLIPEEAGDDDALHALLEQGVVDVALADVPLDSESFESHTIFSDPCVLLVPTDSEWTTGSPPQTAEDFACVPLIALDGWRFMGRLEAWFASHGQTPTFVQRARSGATVRALVAAGHGVAILPALAAEGEFNEVIPLSLRGLVPTRRIAFQWNGARRSHSALPALLEAGERIGARLRDQRLARRERPAGAPGPAGNPTPSLA